MTGYSGTPLAKKLGIKPGFSMQLVNSPDYYFELFSDLPEGLTINESNVQIDFIHYFAVQAAQLKADIINLRKSLKPNGMIWISWYKKSANKSTDITENTIREIALSNGLVDIKVCAVDEFWSGLKLVIPLKDRITQGV